MSNAKNLYVARCIVTFLCDGCQIAEQSLRTSPYEKKVVTALQLMKSHDYEPNIFSR